MDQKLLAAVPQDVRDLERRRVRLAAATAAEERDKFRCAREKMECAVTTVRVVRIIISVLRVVGVNGRRLFSEKRGVKENGRSERLRAHHPATCTRHPLPHQAKLLQKSGIFHGTTSTQVRMIAYSAAERTIALASCPKRLSTAWWRGCDVTPTRVATHPPPTLLPAQRCLF